jgi:hypothetical protein
MGAEGLEPSQSKDLRIFFLLQFSLWLVFDKLVGWTLPLFSPCDAHSPTKNGLDITSFSYRKKFFVYPYLLALEKIIA